MPKKLPENERRVLISLRLSPSSIRRLRRICAANKVSQGALFDQLLLDARAGK